MGSSYVEYHGIGFEANDAALEVWLQLLVREIDALGDVAPWLREMREAWHLHSTAGFGFGVVPNLDRFVTDDARRAVVLSLCDWALRRLDALGDTFGRDALNAMGVGGEGAHFTRDIPTAFFNDIGRQFVGLLRGEPDPI